MKKCFFKVVSYDFYLIIRVLYIALIFFYTCLLFGTAHQVSDLAHCPFILSSSVFLEGLF